MTEQPAGGGLTEMLDSVPAEARLFLRDVIRGLEAEAGNARAEAAEIQSALDADIARLRLFAAGLAEKLAAAESDRDKAQRDLAEARTELAASHDELAVAQAASARRGWTKR